MQRNGEEQMKLISWNVNGLRAVMGKNFMEEFKRLDADFFCLQETKLQAGQIELELPGYHQYWNYAEKKGYETEEASELLQFADFDEISPYALDAMKWAYAKEMLKGVSETHISPKTTATRAQVAAILMRFCEKLAK